MALNNPNAHYVKFFRGSTAAWNALLLTPEKVDNDTLYFIYESAEESDNGKLYLGQKLISSTDSSGGVINISDIQDIYIDNEDLRDKQILTYNATNQRWENIDLTELTSSAIQPFSGATSAAAGTSGLVPQPKAGDEGKFLRGDGSWAALNFPTFDSNVFQVVTGNVITLTGITQAPVGSIPVKTAAGGIEWATISAGTISRQIISKLDLQTLLANGTASENTIYMVPLDETIDSSDQYEEFMVISGELEKIGTIGDVDLADYVTDSVFQNAVGNLNTALYGDGSTEGLIDRVSFIEEKVGDLNDLLLSAGNTTLVEEINTINENIEDLSERLQWQELKDQE